MYCSMLRGILMTEWYKIELHFFFKKNASILNKLFIFITIANEKAKLLLVFISKLFN